MLFASSLSLSSEIPGRLTVTEADLPGEARSSILCSPTFKYIGAVAQSITLPVKLPSGESVQSTVSSLSVIMSVDVRLTLKFMSVE